MADAFARLMSTVEKTSTSTRSEVKALLVCPQFAVKA